MELPDLKKLNKIIALCRRQGVETIEIDNIKITLKDVVITKTRRAKKASSSTPSVSEDDSFESDGWDSLTEEQKLTWSSGIPGTES